MSPGGPDPDDEAVRRLSLAALPWGLLLVAPLGGCGEDRGQGEIVGSLRVPDCRLDEPLEAVCPPSVPLEACEAFDLGSNFFALDLVDRMGRMRIQEGGRSFAQTDGVLLEIRDVRVIRGRLGEPIPVGPDAEVRAALGLFDRCPDSALGFDLRGTVVFDAFGVHKGDAVRGRIERLEVRDARGEEGRPGAILGLLRGDFDFRLRRGPPYQQFSR